MLIAWNKWCWSVAATALACGQLTLGAERNAYFGDLHVHTRFSMDAFSFGTRTTPDDAYRFARGEVIQHPAGFDVQLDQPLDFYAVTDHAEYLGGLNTMSNPNHPLHAEATRLGILNETTVAARARSHPDGVPFVARHITKPELRSAWQEIVNAAERHNETGQLTTFVAYEYTSFREGGNLHRNVIFKDNNVPTDIFGRLESFNPEDLWVWMDKQRELGMESLAIPHNANGSDGWMFDTLQWDGSPIDADYSALRMRNEPLVEITQVKGTSETHPFLSPNDEWADFEIFPYRIARWLKSKPRGSYVRDAYLTGLQVADRVGNTTANPYKFGIIGASDTHNSGSRFDEKTYAGKVGVLDAFGERRGSVPVSAVDVSVGGDGVSVDSVVPAYRNVFRTHYGASGLTGVWAEENSRASIYSAFRRKETFATSGSRIRIRLFGGYGFPNNLHQSADIANIGYAKGVPQGGDLVARRRAPQFAVTAIADATAAPLQRLQIVKGWLAEGLKREQVFDVACSDGLNVDPNTHRCPDNRATVELTTCAISAEVGAPQLSATWTDPDYDRTQSAFYYARAIENPTCRWSTWDAVKAGVAPRAGYPTTLQERAWTSPIWVGPDL